MRWFENIVTYYFDDNKIFIFHFISVNYFIQTQSLDLKLGYFEFYSSILLFKICFMVLSSVRSIKGT